MAGSDYLITIKSDAQLSALQAAGFEIKQIGENAEDSKKKVEEAGSSLASFGQLAVGVQAARQEVQQYVQALEQVVGQADELGDLASRFQVSAEQLQVLRNAGVAFGTESGAIDDSLRNLNRTLAEAAAGNGKLVDKFQEFGVTAEQIKTGDVFGAFTQLSDSLSSATDKTAAFGDAQDLLGRNALAVRDTLLAGSAAIKQQGEAMGVISDATIAKLSALQPKIDELNGKFNVAKAEAAALFLDFENALGEGLARSLDQINAIVGTLAEKFSTLGGAAGAALSPLQTIRDLFTASADAAQNFNAAQSAGESVDQRRADNAARVAEEANKLAAATSDALPPAEGVAAANQDSARALADAAREQAQITSQLEQEERRRVLATAGAEEKVRLLNEEVEIQRLLQAGQTAEAAARQRSLEVYRRQIELSKSGVSGGDEARKLAEDQVDAEKRLSEAKDKTREIEKAKSEAARETAAAVERQTSGGTGTGGSGSSRNLPPAQPATGRGGRYLGLEGEDLSSAPFGRSALGTPLTAADARAQSDRQPFPSPPPPLPPPAPPPQPGGADRSQQGSGDAAAGISEQFASLKKALEEQQAAYKKGFTDLAEQAKAATKAAQETTSAAQKAAADLSTTLSSLKAQISALSNAAAP